MAAFGTEDEIGKVMFAASTSEAGPIRLSRDHCRMGIVIELEEEEEYCKIESNYSTGKH